MSYLGQTAAANQPSYIPTPPTAVNAYDPTVATNELTSAAGVQNQQQDQNLMSMLAAQGISPGSSAAQAAGQNLAGAQTAALAPSLVSAQQFGAGLSNTDTLQNLQNLLQSQQFNASAFNDAGSQTAGFQNQDWLAQLQAQLGLQQSGLNTSGSLAGAQANQSVPMDPSLFSQLTGAASAAAPFSVASRGSGGGGGSANSGMTYGTMQATDPNYGGYINYGSGGG